ncbi:MAG: hypothetical protein BWK78_05285 [Thiotrichaceae bacterium IS1]|nr:MAG: hypothetical protein BWK78_05285 [Thiotrichaceae bacterium IS1]
MKYLFLSLLLGIAWVSIHHITLNKLTNINSSLVMPLSEVTVTKVFNYLLSTESASLLRVEESRAYGK